MLYLSNRLKALEFGLNVKGEVESVPQLGDIVDAKIGDVYLVGKIAPFYFYVKTADKTRTNLGTLESTVPGPQGERGLQGLRGETGNKIYTINQPETANVGDISISLQGEVSQFDGANWVIKALLKGPIGPVGPRGLQGERGLQGIGVNIGGVVSGEDLLPKIPSSGVNAYLVGVKAPYQLFVWAEIKRGWLNAGVFATIDNIQVITINQPETATQGTLDSQQLSVLNQSTSALIKHGNLIYRKEAVISTKSIYRCITDDMIYIISINNETGSWVKEEHILSQYWDVTDIPRNSISSDYIADGAVVSEKLGTDVHEKLNNFGVNIKNNQYFARFNSNRLDILEAQINAGKNTIEFTSDKELEITCGGANIIDCNAHFKKIQGQSRRRSLNLIEVPKSSVSSNGITATFQNGVVILNGTATGQTNINISKQYNENDITLKNKTLLAYSSTKTSTDVEVHFYGTDFKSHKVFNLRYATEPSFLNENISFYGAGLTIPQGTTFNDLKIFIEIVNGSFDTSTMPSFEPYDAMLVNSQASFLSSGRNLFSSDSFNETNLKYNASTCEMTVSNTDSVIHSLKRPLILPKGTYTFLRSVGDENINTFFVPKDGDTVGIGYNSNMVVATLERDTEFIEFSTSVAKTKSFKIAIVAGDVAYDEKYFEPYIKNISKIDIELGAFDSIENGNLIEQTSEVITLNGAENWTIEGGSPNKRFRFLNSSIVGFKSNTNINLATNSLLDSTTANHTWGDTTGRNMISFDSDTFHIVINGITTVQQLKDWLKAHPITLVIKLRIPVISTAVIPNGIISFNKGLTHQITKLNKLPYKYTAKFVNGGPQE